MEVLMEEIAEQLGMDVVDFKRENLIQAGEPMLLAGQLGEGREGMTNRWTPAPWSVREQGCRPWITTPSGKHSRIRADAIAKGLAWEWYFTAAVSPGLIWGPVH